MPRFAANLTMLFNEMPFEARFAAAKSAGFDYVEYLFPYAWEAATLAEHLQKNQLEQVLFNLPPGHWDAGERGIAGLPGRQTEFREGVQQALDYADALGVHQLNCLAGLIDPAHSFDTQWSVLTENVHFAAEACQQRDIHLLVEPINSRVDMPGFLLDTIDKAEQLITDVQHENLSIQFDVYHMQIMHGDVTRLLQQHIHQVRHIQFADNPGRHEPGTGELNFQYLFAQIDDLAYDGFVSAEYRPLHSTTRSLHWLPSR